MAKKRIFSDTQYFSNRHSFDGKPLEKGKALVPFRKDVIELKKSDYIQDNFTTMHIGGIKFEIGFMAIDESKFALYMREFWDEIEAELNVQREGRCILGYKKTGDPILCSKYHRCKGCPNKGVLERLNPNRVEIFSLDFEYEGNCFDIADNSQPSVEEQVLSRLEPNPELMPEELETGMLAHFDQKKPRYASIMRMKLQGFTDKQIVNELGLSTGRGYEEIQNAYNAACDYLHLEHYKIKKRNK